MIARSTLTLQFIPYADLEGLGSQERVARLLKTVKENKILLLEGRLAPAEEAELIRRTMEEISERFKGIEISPLAASKRSGALLHRVKELLANLLLGQQRGLTIIGPASLVKEIKQDPDKIQLLLEDAHGRKRRK